MCTWQLGAAGVVPTPGDGTARGVGMPLEAGMSGTAVATAIFE
jgi:hypothetical protein